MPLDHPSIQDTAQTNHKFGEVAYMDAYRINSYREPTKMGNSLQDAVLFIKAELKALEPQARAILLEIVANPGITNKVIRERTGLTRGPLGRLTDKCIEKKLITKKQLSDGVKSPWHFYWNKELLGEEDALLLLKELGVTAQIPKRKKIRSKTPSKQTIQLDLDPPKFFESFFSDSKSSARQGLWEAFLFMARNPGAPAKDLEQKKSWSSSVVSERLKKLRDAELLERKKEATFVYFPTQQAINLCQMVGIEIKSIDQKQIGLDENGSINHISLSTHTSPEPLDAMPMPNNNQESQIKAEVQEVNHGTQSSNPQTFLVRRYKSRLVQNLSRANRAVNSNEAGSY